MNKTVLRKIWAVTAMYYKAKKKNQMIFSELLLSKQTLKYCQNIYWNYKDFRTENVFIKLYETVNQIYENNKIKYAESCKKLKHYKKEIRFWNSKLERNI